MTGWTVRFSALLARLWECITNGLTETVYTSDGLAVLHEKLNRPIVHRDFRCAIGTLDDEMILLDRLTPGWVTVYTAKGFRTLCRNRAQDRLRDVGT